MTFIKKPITSNASRKIWFFKKLSPLTLKMSRLSLPKNSKYGKSFTNKRILRTSSTRAKVSRRHAIAYSITQKCLGIVSSFFFIPFKNRFLSLLILSNGLICYTPSLENQSFFQYFKTVSKLNTRFYKFQIFFNRIAYIKKLSLISLLELSPFKGAQYIRGVGAKGRLFAIDKIENTAIVELPSKLKKLFPLFSVCAVGRLMGEENRFFANTKSGYWRLFGKKPMVRGVAKNPVDHPHGGRTKSVKYPRTPWGKTTKFK